MITGVDDRVHPARAASDAPVKRSAVTRVDRPALDAASGSGLLRAQAQEHPLSQQLAVGVGKTLDVRCELHGLAPERLLVVADLDLAVRRHLRHPRDRLLVAPVRSPVALEEQAHPDLWVRYAARKPGEFARARCPKRATLRAGGNDLVVIGGAVGASLLARTLPVS
jgi:hypothetical protein